MFVSRFRRFPTVPGTLLALGIAVSAWSQGRTGQPETTPPVSSTLQGTHYFRITIVDDETGRGIPCVRLKMTNTMEYWTDSAGVVAFYEPDLMGHEVYFTIESHGYTFPPDDWFKMHGRVVRPTPGGGVVLKMHRDNIAQRLYRMTGAGIYHDSVLLGDEVPPAEEPGRVPVAGQDGGDAVLHNGKLYWFWGDTGIPRFPLGVFKGTGAISDLPGHGGLDPEVGVAYRYFRNESEREEVRGIFDLPGNIYWYAQLRTVLNDEGQEKLLANYAEIAQPMRVVERGFVEWNDDRNVFELLGKYPDDPVIPIDHYGGPPFRHPINGKEYFYYPSPYPSIRCPIDYKSQIDLDAREAFTCLKQGSRFDGSPEQLDRAPDGTLQWSWKFGTSPVGEREMFQLVKSGAIRPEERWHSVRDVDSGTPVLSHGGSIYYNKYRNRWVCTRLQTWGVTLVGELWYLEADTPMGPWVYARKVITHKWKDHDYAFYTAGQIPELDMDDGRSIFLKGSFSAEFGNEHNPVPRQNYNVFAYKLDLGDPRIVLPVPVYRVGDAPARYGTKEAFDDSQTERDIVWFAPDRPFPDSIPVYQVQDADNGGTKLTLEAPPSNENPAPAFHALPFDPSADDISSTSSLGQTVPLREFINSANGKCIYTTEETVAAAGYRQSPAPICRVWPNPILFNPYRQ